MLSQWHINLREVDDVSYEYKLDISWVRLSQKSEMKRRNRISICLKKNYSNKIFLFHKTFKVFIKRVTL